MTTKSKSKAKAKQSAKKAATPRNGQTSVHDILEKAKPLIEKLDGVESVEIVNSDAVLNSESGEFDTWKRQHYEEIRDKEKEVRSLESVMNSAKAEYKAAKDDFELADAGLRALIARGPDRQQKLPLADADKPAADSWKSIELRTIPNITSAVADILTKVKLSTLGKLADWTSKYQLTDVNGIGPAKAEEIEDALAEWWSDHPEYSPATEPILHSDDNGEAVSAEELVNRQNEEAVSGTID